MSSQCNMEHPTLSHSLLWTGGVRLTLIPTLVDLPRSSTDPNELVTARPNDRVCSWHSSSRTQGIVSELETASRKRNNAPKSRALAARTCTPV